MGFISRGFRGRPKVDAEPGRVPPGQYVTTDFPVLSAGPTPDIPLDRWRFSIGGQVEGPLTWTWKEFLALPSEEVTVDIEIGPGKVVLLVAEVSGTDSEASPLRRGRQAAGVT